MVAGRISLRVKQLDVPVQTKTKDNVFVDVIISVQYECMVEKTFEAYYKLNNPELQIQSYVFDVVRSAMPKMDLDEVGGVLECSSSSSSSSSSSRSSSSQCNHRRESQPEDEPRR